MSPRARREPLLELQVSGGNHRHPLEVEVCLNVREMPYVSGAPVRRTPQRMLEILTDMSDGPDDTMCEKHIENLISIQRSSVENEVRETMQAQGCHQFRCQECLPSMTCLLGTVYNVLSAFFSAGK